MGVEALRAGKQALLWLTKDAVHLATDGFVGKVAVPGAPDVAELHVEYVERGGQLYACPVCVKLRRLEDATLAAGAQVTGAPLVYEFTDGGALTLNY